MQPAMRLYQGEEDYWRIRQFLREVSCLNGRRDRSWNVVRFDYWRWHVNENIEHHRLEERVFIWETGDGRMAAVLNPEGQGEAFLQVHPAFDMPKLVDELLEVAEANLAVTGADGRRHLQVWANEDDILRREVLNLRGYTRGAWPEYQRRRPMALPLPDAPVAAGYTVRALGDVVELPARSMPPSGSRTMTCPNGGA